MKSIPSFTLSAICGCLLSFGLTEGHPLLLRASWTLSWACFFAALQSLQNRRNALSGFLIGLSLLAGGFWFIPAAPTLQIPWIAAWIAGLSIIWPLRFIALGEIASALLGGFFFWHTGLRFMSVSPSSLLALYVCSTLWLFVAAFLDNASRYAQQKAMQQYSLPVLAGHLFPSLDKRWSGGLRPVCKWLVIALYISTVVFFLYR